MARSEVNPNELGDWLAERIKDFLPGRRRILDGKRLDELGAATGREWTFGNVGEREPKGVVRAYLSHDASGSTVYVFVVERDRGSLDDPQVDWFFHSIMIREFLGSPEKK
jgi:hypothetical protein